MRLSQIKLVGFKSFVDPTVLQLPTNLTGVVGPNGCGKSNIIDAIRWVMGESAASRLRGDSLTDVIFNGSSGRKPVGQASVELVFDNSDGFIQGEFAAYSDISVKRIVTRDGQSSYFLNQNRCRRRDITDLFLGTGLGARSYSIIEQGMVSQIVESAPEDLRVHLEEAAGISKYKERRKETESRMKATRENLDRLNDVREEVEKQLSNLERQAKQAERYTELKTEKARVDAELAALSWQKLESERRSVEEKLKNTEGTLEELAAIRTRVESQDSTGRVAHEEAVEAFNAIQAESYRVGGDIARLEQELKFRKDLTERGQRELSEAIQQQSYLKEQLDADDRQAVQLREALEIDEPKLEALSEISERDIDALKNAEAAQSEWQRRFSEHSQASSAAAKMTEVERTKIELLERTAQDKLKRRNALIAEQGIFNLDALGAELEQLNQESELLQEQLEQLNDLSNQRKQGQLAAQNALQTANAALRESEQQLGASVARAASLEALQNAALGQDQKDRSRWLAERGLENAPRLGDVITVDAGYEAALEAVLGDLLQAVVVPDSAALEPEGLPGGVLVAVTGGSDALISAGGDAQSLAAKVRGPAALSSWLAGIWVADNLLAAKQKAAQLSGSESVVSRDGHWLSRDWVRLKGAGQAFDGVLARGREITELKDKIEALREHADEARDGIEQRKAEVAQSERSKEDAQTQVYAQQRKVSEHAGKLTSQKGRLEQSRSRAERIGVELASIAEQLETEDVQVRDARAKLEEGLELMGAHEDERHTLESERVKIASQLETARLGAREARERAHQLELAVQGKKTALTSLELAMTRINANLETLATRKATLETQIEQSSAPLEGLADALQIALEQRTIVDKRIAEARAKVDDCVEALRKLDTERQRAEQQMDALREGRSTSLLKAQELSIREEGFLNAIQQSGFAREELLEQMPSDANMRDWDQRSNELEGKIKRLEPVNLAAIKELEEAMQRKTYLDSQLLDLNTALETLDEAIKKIDRETRARFKETFEQVNTGFQTLFPRLFGGGDARLELTGEDLLETGVNIIARPPGKRPATIGLLSGGEKALTAVALIFAIFQLNPAPFCLLDEVDAPLDEANVGRFSKLVEEMSQTVQFIFVSHNKVTMEHARQLAGVTMREPGVSRLVSVDLAEAAKLVSS
jgi:chromosome segregation protein